MLPSFVFHKSKVEFFTLTSVNPVGKETIALPLKKYFCLYPLQNRFSLISSLRQMQQTQTILASSLHTATQIMSTAIIAFITITIITG
ncbi:MAG: hypothetical protein JSS93_13235 [Bacteroidetes bacterium]|nr:hypothetical protein [Bacteroidota bacterium]